MSHTNKEKRKKGMRNARKLFPFAFVAENLRGHAEFLMSRQAGRVVPKKGKVERKKSRQRNNNNNTHNMCDMR